MIVTDLSKSFNPVPKESRRNDKKKAEGGRIKKKSSKLAKLEKNRTSILQKDEGKCFICKKKIKLDKHEAFGGRNRQKSIIWKLIYYLCRECHSKADLDKNIKQYLHDYAREKFIQKYSEEKFLKEFGKMYKK